MLLTRKQLELTLNILYREWERTYDTKVLDIIRELREELKEYELRKLNQKKYGVNS